MIESKQLFACSSETLTKDCFDIVSYVIQESTDHRDMISKASRSKLRDGILVGERVHDLLFLKSHYDNEL